MKTSITSVPVWAWNPGCKNAMLIDKMLVVLNSNGRSTPAQASMWNSGHLIPRPSRRHRTEGSLPVTRPGEADPALPGAGSRKSSGSSRDARRGEDAPAKLGAQPVVGVSSLLDYEYVKGPSAGLLGAVLQNATHDVMQTRIWVVTSDRDAETLFRDPMIVV